MYRQRMSYPNAGFGFPIPPTGFGSPIEVSAHKYNYCTIFELCIQSTQSMMTHMMMSELKGMSKKLDDLRKEMDRVKRKRSRFSRTNVILLLS